MLKAKPHLVRRTVMPLGSQSCERNQNQKRIPETLLRQLKTHMAGRKIESGIRCLDSHRDLIASCNPDFPNACILLGYLAQWVDIGFSDLLTFKALIERFDSVSRESLSVLEYVHLNMAQGFVDLCRENREQGIRHFETVLSLAPEIKDKQLVAIAEFWMGRCLRQQGRYQDALPHVIRAKRMLLELKCPELAAVAQVLEGWITFQQGDSDEAVKILSDAEAILNETDDYVTRGNINSAYGRIARRRGQYEQALARFSVAIEEYKKRDPYHRNLGRSLVNIAFVKRLFALQLRNKIDRDAADHRRVRRNGDAGAANHLHPRQYLERLRKEGFEHLEEATAIYGRLDDFRGQGNVHITRGYLYLDGGQLDLAALEGSRAHDLGAAKKNDVLQARSRVLQSLVESAKIEEQIEDGASEKEPSLLAYEFGRDAVAHAKCTQNKRLTAKAYIALGLAVCNSTPDETESAWECCDQATALLNPENKDYVWRHLLQSLKNKLRNTGAIDSRLREWSQGIIGNKTFQQVSQEFASMVIPRVWKREGRRISHVAARLSISPKKVRKILRDQGLLSRSSQANREPVLSMTPRGKKEQGASQGLVRTTELPIRRQRGAD
jgi:tetratricopeptide (TPR) repeat protein